MVIHEIFKIHNISCFDGYNQDMLNSNQILLM